MDSSEPRTADFQHAIWHEAVDKRDPSFDGVFFVAITSTRIYCRPVCPSRLARRTNRRFFVSREDAEAAGFRACRRCRPELAQGETPLDAVPPGQKAAEQISSGALNGKSVLRRFSGLPAALSDVADRMADASAARVKT